MRNLEPKRRFKGFAGPWEKRKLGDVIEKMYNGQTPSRFNSDNWGGNISWLSSGELNRGVVTKTIEKITDAGQKDANLRIVPKGVFVIAITGLEAEGTRGNCAKLAINTALNQSCMALFPRKNVLDSDFLFHWYRKVGEAYGNEYTQGTKQQSYNAELLKILPITQPQIDEQKKLAFFLTSLDNLITLQQRKINKLRELKSAYLYEMFPQEGELYPERRFAGFTGPWEQCKVGDYYDFKNGLNKGKEFFGTGTPIVNFTDVFHNRGIYHENLNGRVTLEPSEVRNYEVKKGDLFFTRTSETIGEIGYPSVMLDAPRNTVFSGFVLRGRSKSSEDPLDNFFKKYVFLTNAFRVEMTKNSSMTTRALTSGTAIKNMTFTCPASKGEQIKIGTFFSNLDNLIALQQRKLEKLEALKKAYLNEMFV